MPARSAWSVTDMESSPIYRLITAVLRFRHLRTCQFAFPARPSDAKGCGLMEELRSPCSRVRPESVKCGSKHRCGAITSRTSKGVDGGSPITLRWIEVDQRFRSPNIYLMSRFNLIVGFPYRAIQSALSLRPATESLQRGGSY
jgi:hypothetical protein